MWYRLPQILAVGKCLHNFGLLGNSAMTSDTYTARFGRFWHRLAGFEIADKVNQVLGTDSNNERKLNKKKTRKEIFFLLSIVTIASPMPSAGQ